MVSPRGVWQSADGIGLAIVALALLGWGVAQPLVWPYLLGAVLVGLYCASVAHHLLAVRSRRRAVRVTAAVAVAALVAGVVVAVPRIGRTVQADASTRWRTELPTRWVDVVPWRDRVYLYESLHGFRVLDGATGRELFAVGGVKVSGELAGDGSVVLYNEQAAEHYAPDGKRRWRLDGRAWALVTGTDTETTAVAASGGVVVFQVCETGGCRYVGVGSNGAIVWQRVATRQWVNGQLPFTGSAKGGPLPGAVVVRTSESSDAEVVTYAAADGEELDRRPARAAGTVGVVGDLVVFGGLDDRGCAFTGVRSGRQVWHATGLPCAEGSTPSPLLLEHRLYATVDDGSVTVDLRDGSWRRVAQVALSAKEHGQRKIGLAGDDVIVYRDGRNLTGVDAAKGTELWTFEQPGEDTPGIDVGSGAVIVYGDPGGHNPMLPPDVRRSGYLVTVLDARSGARTGRTVLPVDGFATSGPLPAGRAVVVTTEHPEARLIGAR